MMLSYLNKLFRLFWRQDMGDGAAKVVPLPVKPAMPTVLATAAINTFPAAPAVEISTPAIDRMLAARLMTVARLNPPTSRGRKAKPATTSPGGKPVRCTQPTSIKRQPATGPVRKSSTRTANLPGRPSADIIDLSAARHARRSANRCAA